MTKCLIFEFLRRMTLDDFVVKMDGKLVKKHIFFLHKKDVLYDDFIEKNYSRSEAFFSRNLL